MSAYQFQVGGHAEFVNPSSDYRVVLKPYDSCEFAFYSRLLASKASKILPFTARCFGAVGAVPASSDPTPTPPPEFVMLEDLAHGLTRPAIADLKMGLCQRSLRDGSPEKISRARQKALQTTSHRLGFHLCGVAFWESAGRNFQDKYQGRKLDELGVYETFKSFFMDKIELIGNFVAKLRALAAAIAELPGLRFWSGSLLLVYDVEDPEICTLKMIDFAQTAIVPESEIPDNEYLFGVKNLIAYLEALQQRDSSPHPPPLDTPDPALQDAELFRILDNTSASL